jgi:CDP-diacylglycerol--serine O-phosphatidyltransferase
LFKSCQKYKFFRAYSRDWAKETRAWKKSTKKRTSLEVIVLNLFFKNLPMNLKAHVPNAITLGNLFCGCIAVVFALGENFEMAFLFVALGIFLDFFDGFFARIFKVSSELGLQLDSLADMVTSGVTPGLVMYQLLKSGSGWNFEWIPFLGFLITLGSCYRLANFNIDTRQTDSFIGLPTPANALFIMSLPLVKAHTDSFFVLEALTDHGILLAITLFSAYILNAEIPLFALKVKEFSFGKNALQLVFLAISLVLLISLQYLGIPLVIITYILMSVINNKFLKK